MRTVLVVLAIIAIAGPPLVFLKVRNTEYDPRRVKRHHHE